MIRATRGALNRVLSLRRAVFTLSLVSLGSAVPGTAGTQTRGAAALREAVDALGVRGRVLLIAAHPDDEDTQLITWLVRGRHVETAYLALTRGDGGQNLIGSELGQSLGIIRTEELLAARRLDGGRQYFTRAFDFGFSKSAEETLQQWSQDSVLRDVVTVVRAFKPHVIVSVFSGTPADGHGHHQVAGRFARVAYDLSGDTTRFPAAATAGLGPWTVSKFYRSANFRNQELATLRINVGEYSPTLGRSFAEIAAESRSQHKSQGMGALQQKGVRFDLLHREAARVGPTEAKQERSIFDGIDTTWAALTGTSASRQVLTGIATAARRAGAMLERNNRPGLWKELSTLQRLLSAACGREGHGCPGATGDARASLTGLQRRLTSALTQAADVSFEAEAGRDVVAIGESTAVRVTFFNRGRQAVRVQDVGLRVPGEPTVPLHVKGRDVLPDSATRDSLRISLPRGTPPWWLAVPRQGAMFGVAADTVAETDRWGPAIEASVEALGTRFTVQAPIVFRTADPVRGDISSPVDAAPAITLRLDRDVAYVAAGALVDREISAQVQSFSRDAREVVVRLELPDGLTAEPRERRIMMRAATFAQPPTGVMALLGIGSAPPEPVLEQVVFRVRGQLPVGAHALRAVAESGGQRFTTGFSPLSYDHIRTRRPYHSAAIGVTSVDVRLPPNANVAYIRGVGDDIAPVLQELGIPTAVLTPAALARENLSTYSAIVVGTRAYESQPALVQYNARLLDYARNGGTLVVQYGQYEMLQPGIMPYPIALSRPADRVTVEGAPVQILNESAPILTTPNRITARDFDGWVQDRSLYMPKTFDPSYRPVLELHDPGEPPNQGGLLVAPLGKGTYVYTTLAFFRQLPAGVPGAIRLFVNLLAAGNQRTLQ